MHLARRTACTLAAVAAALPAAAAASPADRGPIRYTQFDTVRSVLDAAPAITDPFSVPAIAAGAEPAASPDGRSLAWFTGPAFGPYDGVAVDDGTGPRQVLRVGTGGVVTGVDPSGAASPGVITNFDLNGITDRLRMSGLSWSPDGNSVRLGLVITPGMTLLTDVVVATGAVSTPGVIRHPRNMIARDIAWSPAGDRVAFTAAVTRAGDPGCTAGRYRLYTTELTGYTPVAAKRVIFRRRMCPSGPVDFRHPAFSPDGTRLIATRVRDLPGGGGSVSDLVRVLVRANGSAGSAPVPVAAGLSGIGQAVYSPGGERIAYTFMRTGPGEDGLGGIGVMDANGTARHDVLTGPVLIVQQPDWARVPAAPAD